MTDEEKSGGPRRYKLEAEAGSFKMAGQEAELRLIVKAVKKNRLLIGAYCLITVVGLFPAYFSRDCWSVAITFLVDVLTLLVGWHIAHEVITIRVGGR